MYFPEDKVSEVQNAVDIVDIISEAVILKKVGRNFLGLCPFHSEKTPSFSVSPDKQIFHCFGCGVGGNVYKFLMKQNSISFPEAVKMLAEQRGIDLPTSVMSPVQKKEILEKEGILSANKHAMEFFKYLLLKNTSGQKAKKYFERRRISTKLINQFCLGYSLDGWDKLYNFLIKKNFSKEILEKAGLIISKKNGGFYDRFRNKIMFPIINTRQQVIGFGSRVIDDSMPKYLNSPETLVYNKSRSLYGLFASKKYCRSENRVYIVEGYFDFLSLFSNNINNVVATLGTALTRQHIRILKGCAENMVLVYDSDDAGFKAARRSAGLFMKEGVAASVSILPKGHDPDSFLAEFGVKAFYNASKKALGIMSFLIDSAIKKHKLSIQGKLNIIADMKISLTSINDTVAKSLCIKELSEKIDIDEAAIFQELRKTQLKTKQEINQISSQFTGKRVKIEEKLITMMLQFPEVILEIEKRRILNLFENEKLKGIGLVILKNQNIVKDGISNFISILDDEEQSRLVALLAIKEEVWNINGCLKIIEHFETICNKSNNELLERIKIAEKEENQELLYELLKKKMSCSTKIKKVRPNKAYFV
mmetsp:Transcript_13457/g.6608  ORF Transcript_13457/g.6608 Transcript_13457/m.6608 type:complete len:591 (-) Transcript_13457:34-1806(-)